MSKSLEMHVAWAENTIRAYKADFDEWEGFCSEHGYNALPGDPDGLAAYVKTLVRTGRPLQVVQRKVCAIGRLHEESGLDNPMKTEPVKKVMMGAKLILGESKPRRKISDSEASELVGRITSEGATYDRDKAMVLLIHATDMRTSEIASLIWADLSFLEDGGLEVRIRKGVNRFRKKENTYILIPKSEDKDVCVVRAIETWNANISTPPASPVFRGINRHNQVASEALSEVGIRWVLKPVKG